MFRQHNQIKPMSLSIVLQAEKKARLIVLTNAQRSDSKHIPSRMAFSATCDKLSSRTQLISYLILMLLTDATNTTRPELAKVS